MTNQAPHCSVCTRLLKNPSDPLRADCGGDCLQCMADADDQECTAAVVGTNNERK